MAHFGRPGLESGPTYVGHPLYGRYPPLNNGNAFVKPQRASPSIYVHKDVESQSKYDHGNPCRTCFVWIVIFLALILLLDVVIGALYIYFFASNLPEARLHRLDVSQVNLTTTPNRETLLTSNVTAYINITNNSGKVEFQYSPMIASVSWSGIEFPDVYFSGMHHRGHDHTDLKVESTVVHKVVEDVDGKEFAENAKARALVIDVAIKGWIEYIWKGKSLQKLPFGISCQSIRQWDVDNGLAPSCDVNFLAMLVPED